MLSTSSGRSATGRAEPGQRLTGWSRESRRGDVADYQWSALLDGHRLQGMTADETAGLTKSMMRSGTGRRSLEPIPGRKIDKHSTGGVGDKTSLILAPIAAAAGVSVPMVSGRGLGHTGGTLDKLESIPGFRTDLDLHRYHEMSYGECGLVMIGQTAEIAPADKFLYALARCHGDGRVDPADRRLDHVQEAGRGYRRPGARRQDRATARSWSGSKMLASLPRRCARSGGAWASG